MKANRPALRYAKALLNLAKEKGVDEKVNNDMLLLIDTIEESKDFDQVLQSPVIKAADKLKVAQSLFEKHIDTVTLGLINLLAENKRLAILNTIAKQYRVLYDFHKSIDVAKVITAVPLTAELQEVVSAKVKELTGNESSLENEVDPSILGGFVLRVGDIQYDASILNSIKHLKNQFDNSHFEAKI